MKFQNNNFLFRLFYVSWYSATKKDFGRNWPDPIPSRPCWCFNSGPGVREASGGDTYKSKLCVPSLLTQIKVT